ncbi:MAG: hypothetical protein K0R38_6752 [Polyangiaceae bacterium]|jgi:hypothetical protein|nr:hypothetical protein [Polyangiaceae bacterium]
MVATGVFAGIDSTRAAGAEGGGETLGVAAAVTGAASGTAGCGASKTGAAAASEASGALTPLPRVASTDAKPKIKPAAPAATMVHPELLRRERGSADTGGML